METRLEAEDDRRFGDPETGNADKLPPNKRSRAKQTLSLEQRLTKTAADYRARAVAMHPGNEQTKLLEKARQFEAQVGEIT
jgi:hypothetical protein